jgi:hypothetical protein
MRIPNVLVLSMNMTRIALNSDASEGNAGLDRWIRLGRRYKTRNSFGMWRKCLFSMHAPANRRVIGLAARGYAAGLAIDLVPWLLKRLVQRLLRDARQHGMAAALAILPVNAIRALSPRLIAFKTHRIGLGLAAYLALFRLLDDWLQRAKLRSLLTDEPSPRAHIEDASHAKTTPDINSIVGRMEPEHITALSGAVASVGLWLMPTLFQRDMAVLMLVRSLDVTLRRCFAQPEVERVLPAILRSHGDVVGFVFCCTEIMFAWFYTPHTLPAVYRQWISVMAELDHRLLDMLRWQRGGKLQYGKTLGFGLEQHLSGCCKQ